MSQRIGPPTPFVERDWARRYEIFDSILTWTLILSSAVALIYGGVFVFQRYEQFLFLFLDGLALAATCLIARALARRGYLDLAIYLLLFGMLLVMSLATLLLQGIVPLAGTFYVVVVVVAGILIEFRASAAAAVVAGILYVIISILSRRPGIALALNEDWIIALTSALSILAFLFAAYLGWLLTRDLRRALVDATYDLVRVNQELKQANQLKARFLANFSHELRTPLNSIIGYSDMCLEGFYGDMNADQRDALERVRRNGHQLLDLINTVLDLSRIEVGKIALREDVFRVEDLVHSVFGTVEPRAQEKGLSLDYEIDPALPSTLLGDEGRLTQILLNLVDNAIKFTDQGSIHITVQPGDADDTWMLRVVDTGRGIPEQELPHVFEEFRQGEIAHTRRSGGVGLGLAIARNLTEIMGGTITVKSSLGVGSTFTIVLPTRLASSGRSHLSEK